MVLILSNEDDNTTNEVIDWLFYYNIPFYRINETLEVEIKTVELSRDKYLISLQLDDTSYASSTTLAFNQNLVGYWYRRGTINSKQKPIKHKYNKTLSQEEKIFRQALNKYLQEEYLALLGFIHLSFKEIKSIGSLEENHTNKLFNMLVAKNIGLDIPFTLITQKPNRLEKVSNQELITKAIKFGGFYINKEYQLNGFTSTVSPKDIPLSGFGFPSLVQEKLDKAYELRIFYLNEKCYASAIFSQLDEKTSVDFRQYNRKRPNRTPPYRLPIQIENMLIKLMKKIYMKSGSIDMVVTKDKRYVFLEVNPIGQFKQVSQPCNYFLEQKIAKFFQNETSMIKSSLKHKGQ